MAKKNLVEEVKEDTELEEFDEQTATQEAVAAVEEQEDDFTEFETAAKPAAPAKKVAPGTKAKLKVEKEKKPKVTNPNPNRIADTVKFRVNPNTAIPGGAFSAMAEILKKRTEAFTLPEGIDFVLAGGFVPAKGASGFGANPKSFIRGYLRHAVSNGWLLEDGVEA